MLRSLNDIMPVLHEKKVCLPGFDIGGGQPDFLLGILTACEAARCPALLLVWAPSASYVGLEALAEVVKFYASRSPVPVVLHLDHGQNEELVVKCLDLGFRSVMFDGSSLPLEENMRRTREVARLARERGASVEGELGRFGEEQGEGPGKSQHTDPAEAERFVKETGVDLLAPAIGNAHGFYKNPPKLRFDLIEEISRRTGVPLSLHGGTGIPMADVCRAGQLGMRKMNVATLLHKQYTDCLKDYFVTRAAANERVQWRKAMDLGRAAIHATVLQYAKDLGVEATA